ncbi:hypothetical protein D3C78_1767930 [compost metagenome]
MSKPAPVIVTIVPGTPEIGLIEVILGGITSKVPGAVTICSPYCTLMVELPIVAP